MGRSGLFAVHPGWQVLLADLGVRVADVLRRAELPADLLARCGATLSTADYWRLWEALVAETAADAEPVALRVGRAISVEAFDPAIFAALASPNLDVALLRVARYKPLVGPIRLAVAVGSAATTLEISYPDQPREPPPELVATELVFFVQLARLATRARIRPLRVTTPRPPSPGAPYRDYFGTRVERADRHTLVFSAADARRPFLTANDAMWRVFEPSLAARLCELDRGATTAERVRAVLHELLPGGTASAPAVAARLAMSPRTLQRRLQAEGASFQRVLDTTRAELARHYLESSSLSSAEIAFLLGFAEPASFGRAYRAWTGETLERARGLARR